MLWWSFILKPIIESEVIQKIMTRQPWLRAASLGGQAKETRMFHPGKKTSK